MILEVASLHVIAGKAAEFQDAFREAEPIISQAAGHISHELNRCIEHPDRFVLLVRWKTLEDHNPGFRNSPDYQRWKALLHHFYSPAPEVLHYERITGATS